MALWLGRSCINGVRSYLRINAVRDLASVAQSSEPRVVPTPAQLVGQRVRERVVRVVDARVEVALAAVPGRGGPDVAVLPFDGRVFPLALIPVGFVNLDESVRSS